MAAINPKSAVVSHHHARVILPPPPRVIYGLRSDRPTLTAQPLERATYAACMANGVLDLRVEWDGCKTHPGHFEVAVGPDTWAACELITPNARQDVILPATAVAGPLLPVRFQRGPRHPTIPFQVKVVPVVWHITLPHHLPPDFVAVRERDYKYADGSNPDVVAWLDSSCGDGVEQAVINLTCGRDYEVWVCLQDPNDPKRWQLQDPIIRSDELTSPDPDWAWR